MDDDGFEVPPPAPAIFHCPPPPSPPLPPPPCDQPQMQFPPPPPPPIGTLLPPPPPMNDSSINWGIIIGGVLGLVAFVIVCLAILIKIGEKMKGKEGDEPVPSTLDDEENTWGPSSASPLPPDYAEPDFVFDPGYVYDPNYVNDQ